MIHEITTYLFGEDFSKSIIEARELNKITHLMQKGISHQGRQHITAQKAETAKTSSRKSLLGGQESPIQGEKVLQELGKAKMNFSNVETVLPLLTEYFERQVNNFEAGQLSKHMPDWLKLTSDTEILTLVSGLPIEFISDKPLQISSISHPLSKSESVILQMQINKLLDKNVLVPSEYEQGEILSPVFLRGKPDYMPSPSFSHARTTLTSR